MKFMAVSFGLLLSMLNGIKSDCNFYQNMEPGVTYYVHNAEYGGIYKGENHCMWQATSPYPIKVNCTDINISATKDCTEEYISIKFAGREEQKFCGQGTFVNEGKNVTIKLDTTRKAKGGKFLCLLKAEEPRDNYNCHCGWKKVTKIVGGKETGVNEYTMMAGLVDSVKRDIFCGATIISDQDVLTAAHCVDDRDISETGVVVGEHDARTGSETKATKLFRMKSCIIHPNYWNDKNTGMTYHDIAICKINGTIQFSAEVGPACLPFQHDWDTFGGAICTALGWGLTSFGGEKADKLQKVDLNIMNRDSCIKYDPSNKDYSNLCTNTTGKDTCQMDSGGPCLWQNPTSYNNVLVCVTSNGIGCASGYPAICTRVGYYIKWIQSVTPDAQYCKNE